MFHVCHVALWSTAGKGLNSCFSCVFVTFPFSVLGQVRYFIVSILDLCLLAYFSNIIYLNTAIFKPCVPILCQGVFYDLYLSYVTLRRCKLRLCFVMLNWYDTMDSWACYIYITQIDVVSFKYIDPSYNINSH